ncbi:MAG: flagellar motor component MotA [Psychrosphaera sp.]|jgi:flagellar motor component MotA
MFKLIGLIICVASIAVVADAQGGIGMYLDIPALVLLFGITLAGMIVGYGKQSIYYFKLAGKDKIPSKDLLPALNFFNYISRLTFYSSICAFFISSIVILINISELTMLGPAIAMTLLNIIYGLIFSFIIIQPIKHGILLNRLKADAEATASTQGK